MKAHTTSRWARLVAIAALVPALAWAQEGPTERRQTIDPEAPVDVGSGHDLHVWTVMDIPILPPGSTLGAICAASESEVYLWSMRMVLSTPYATHTPRVAPEDPPPPADGPGGSFVPESSLLRWDGAAWSTALFAPGETAGSMLACERNDVYVATNAADGTVRLYHDQGRGWRVERLPDGIRGEAGSLVGDRTRVFFRVGDTILMGTGRHWRVAYQNEQLTSGSELVFLDRDHILAPSLDGHAVWNGRDWAWFPNASPMQVSGGWGDRDATGVLHLFGTGFDPAHGGLHVWEYVERTTGTLRGDFVQRVETPRTAGGFGVAAWGDDVHDVYVVGAVHGSGCLLRFNGMGWSEIVPMARMPVPTGLSGTQERNLWIALEDGRVLHGVRGEPTQAAVTPEAPAPGTGTPIEGDVIVRHQAPRSVVVEYELGDGAEVGIAIYNVAGRRVAMLEQARQPAGMHRVRWDAAGVGPGIYFCRVQAGMQVAGGRIVIAR